MNCVGEVDRSDKIHVLVKSREVNLIDVKVLLVCNQLRDKCATKELEDDQTRKLVGRLMNAVAVEGDFV